MLAGHDSPAILMCWSNFTGSMSYTALRRACWRTLPVQLQRPILQLLQWNEYSTTRTVRRFAKYARSRLRDEVVISTTGEIWFRDSGGGSSSCPATAPTGLDAT